MTRENLPGWLRWLTFPVCASTLDSLHLEFYTPLTREREERDGVGVQWLLPACNCYVIGCGLKL